LPVDTFGSLGGCLRDYPISEQQAQRIRQAIDKFKNDAAFGSRFDLYTFQGDTQHALQPKLRICALGTAGPELEQKVASLEADREQIRRERDNLMRGPGNGLTYPSCWTTAIGQTEYIFDVTLSDAGVRVRNATAARANDKAWGIVGPFARDTTINENVFIGATKKLFEWSKGQNCRFYTIVRDATGSSKARYKHLQQMVQGNFYPLYLSPQRRGSDGVAVVPSQPASESTSSSNTGFSPLY
jgi:hypothetical protein